MTPEEYHQAQQLFLELRELDRYMRAERLSEIEYGDIPLASFVRELLLADSADDSFLGNPLGMQADHENLTQTHVEQSQSADALPTHIGRYRVLQRIGEGGHGVVFMAEQTHPIRRKVAIKWIKPGMESKTILARFEAERQALALMKHPSIANVIDAGVSESNQPFFVMELVHGISIDQFCDENRQSLKERLLLFQQVCSAVHHAHRKGIIHRDIKPANVLVTVDSGGPLAKVIDFGIAKAMHLTLTEKTLFTEYGQIVGTLEYMSPEQATMSQNSADVRSDVYSLGVLLYRLLTGQTPISKDELLKDGLWELKNVLENHRPPTPSLRMTSDGQARNWREQVDRAGDWLGRLKGDLDWITMKALAKEPELRYDSVAALSKDIDNFLEGIPVTARPPTVWYVASRWIRRNRAATAIAGATMCCVLISIAALTWGYFKSQQNLDGALEAEQLVAEKAQQLKISLAVVESERVRADENAGRMAKMLKRSILEAAWEKASDGASKLGQASLRDIAPKDRGYVWQLVDSISDQVDWPSLRSEAAGPIRQSAVHPDLGLLAVITVDSNLEVWSVISRRQIHCLALEPDLYTTVAFSTDGNRLLTGRSNDSIQCIDLRTLSAGPRVQHDCGGTRRAVYDARGGRWFVTTGANYLLSFSEDNLELLTKKKLPARVAESGLSPDGSWLIVASLGESCYLFSAQDLTKFQTVRGASSTVSRFRWTASTLDVLSADGNLHSIALSEFESERSVLAFSTGKRQDRLIYHAPVFELGTTDGVLVGDNMGDLRTMVAEDDIEIPLRKYSPAITDLDMLSAQGLLVVTHFNGRVNLVSQQDIDCRRNYVGGMLNVTDGLVYRERSQSLTAHSDGSVRVWNTTSGEIEREAVLHRDEVFCVAINEEEDVIATMGADWFIKLTDIDSLTTQHAIPIALGVRPVEFSHSGLLLAGPADRENPTQQREGTFDLWDANTGKPRRRMVGHDNWIIQFQFSADDQMLGTLSLDGTMKIWEVDSAKCMTTLDLTDRATANHFVFLDPSCVAIAHADGSISLRALESGSELLSKRILSSHISSLVSPQGSGVLMIASNSQPTITCVDASSLEILAQFDAGTGNIIGMKTDAKAKCLQILGGKGAVRIWNLPVKTP